MTNNKNLGKRVKKSKPYMYNTQEHNNSCIPLGSNIQFSTNTEKEQVIIKTNCNNEQIEFLCVQTPFQVTQLIFYIIERELIQNKSKNGYNDQKKLIAIIYLSL